MKGFFAAAVASFIGGVLVILFQLYVLQEPTPQTVREIQLSTVKDSLSLSAKDVARLDHWFNSPDELNRAVRRDDKLEVATFRIRNAGNVDLSDLRFELTGHPVASRSEAFLAYQASAPVMTQSDADVPDTVISKFSVGESEKDLFHPQITADATTLSYTIPLLKAHEETTVTVVTPPVTFPKPLVRAKDVKVEVDSV